MEIVKTINLKKVYDSGELKVTALNRICLEIQEGIRCLNLIYY